MPVMINFKYRNNYNAVEVLKTDYKTYNIIHEWSLGHINNKIEKSKWLKYTILHRS